LYCVCVPNTEGVFSEREKNAGTQLLPHLCLGGS